jgi:hypothetical protein
VDQIWNEACRNKGGLGGIEGSNPNQLGCNKYVEGTTELEIRHLSDLVALDRQLCRVTLKHSHFRIAEPNELGHYLRNL